MRAKIQSAQATKDHREPPPKDAENFVVDVVQGKYAQRMELLEPAHQVIPEKNQLLRHVIFKLQSVNPPTIAYIPVVGA